MNKLHSRMDTKYQLLLDDIRMPKDVATYIQPLELRPQYTDEFWFIVRNYNAFCKCIKLNGLPVKVSFDHDLHPQHITPEHLWHDYEGSKAYQEQIWDSYEEKTGYDCAKYLIAICRKQNKPLPLYTVHSQNPPGRDRILNILQDYQKEYIQRNAV